MCFFFFFFFFSSRRRHTRFDCGWSSDVCSSDLFRVSFGGYCVPSVNVIKLERYLVTYSSWDRITHGILWETFGRIEEPFGFSFIKTEDGTQVIKIGRASCRERV